MAEAQNSDNPPPKSSKTSYAKVIQQPTAALFQHDPVRAAKKTFQDDTMRLISSDSSYKGEPGIIYSSEETAELAARLKFALVGAPQEDIFCTFVYAKCYRNPRRLLWEELTSISNQHAPWLVGGHFNVILHPNENQGVDMRRMGPIDDFNDMMIDTGLMDAGFEGHPFTWTNKRVWKRLDRVLYSKEWTDTYNSTRVQHLPRRLLDHHPLFITAAKIENRKPSSFRFQNMWLKHHNFWDTVRQSWNLPTDGKRSTNISNSPTEEEIKDIVFSVDKDSVAGPDGFPSVFYQSCWDFISNDIQEAVRDFFCADALSKGIHHLFNGNPDMYYQTKCEVKISHLSYADDVILFTNCKEAGPIRLMNFLRNFKQQSRQQVNQAKSAFIQGRKANLIANRIKNITGFSMKALPITYLGAPLYKGNKRKVLYENLIDKVRNRISIPYRNLKDFLQNFSRAPRQNRGKFTTLSGTLSATDEGGLGIRNLRDMDIPRDLQTFTTDSIIWKRLCTIWKEAQGNIFWSLGTGNISFWHDWWLLEGSLDNLVGTQCNLHIPVNWFWNNQEQDILELQQAVPQHMIEQIMEVELSAHRAVADNVLSYSCKTASIPWKPKCPRLKTSKEGVSHHQV
ncbi:hypothetical protein Sango_2102800 [Sesamum angolense]|uniref:Reverse transcriptase n=1 Tax=Sesamum angolense TaxID=2727404 RepID=A0AAE2BM33_9LAMI|nr:hypothetical protein Sango_2102800 [Sesamum angolense]